MAELGSIILRRGSTAERLAFVPLQGEIIYDTELKQVFVGDSETYGGNNVFNEQLVVDDDNNLLAGNNLAIIIDDTGEAKSLRLPGGDKKDRPNPVAGSLRYNENDKVVEYADGNEWFFLNKTVISGDVVELYVSLDGHDDRRYGVQRGRSWGTAFRTVNMAMRLAEDIITANPEEENFVNEQQRIKVKQILVHVATGIYEEHLPIKVPENTSIFGAGQRRTTIRPKIGSLSESPWARIRFWRETAEYPTGYFGYHYLTDPRSQYSPANDNLNNDVFLCNSTNWFHDFSTDKHSSFAFVLDPEGQILTKSPYPHTGACFPKSSYDDDPYIVGFHGGIFADGFSGNQEFNIDSIAGNNLSMQASGFWRKPNMPTAFYADGNRYQAQTVSIPSDAKVNATTKLLANKAFIQAETIAYVNKTYLFEYNQATCRRDLQFILKASSYDSILGTNYFGRIAALSYTRPNSAYVLSDQLAPTIGGLNYAKGQANVSLSTITSVQQANGVLFDDVIDVLTNGVANVDPLVFPTTVYDDAKDFARTIISSNKEFIKAETVSWIQQRILNNTTPFTSDYVYNQEKCKRDIDFVLDALQFDLSFEGNTATIEVANSYWKGLTSQIPTQIQQHVATFGFIKSIIDDIMRSELFTIEQKQQLDIPQTLSDTPVVSEALVAQAQALITIIQEVVEYGTNYAPNSVAPNFATLVANTPPGYVADVQAKIALRTTFVEDFASIIDSTINFINTTYSSFVYDEETCNRDVGLIIDSMVHDLTYGGEAETCQAAGSYFETGSTVVAQQEAETVDAINKARDVALACLAGTTVTPLQAVVTQVPDDGSVTEAGTSAIVTDLFGIITNILTNYIAIKEAHDLILSNIAWIQDEVIAFTNNTYPAFVYNQVLCKRDTGFIVAAISNDLFGGHRRSVEAGRSYYRGVSDLGDPSVAIGSQIIETLAANNHAKYLIGQVLNNQPPAQTYQAVTTQTINAVSVSATVKTLADTLFDIVLDIMENGESQGPQSLPKYNVNISSETPLLPALANRNLTMITAGNKSFVATDWTMFGNLGYGVLARNNARCELVSIFTYYCGYTYKAESGSEIRSLNGSSSNGIYGLGAEGRNPFEVPINAATANETVFIALADNDIVGDNLQGDLQITIKSSAGYNASAAEFFNVMVADVAHGGVTGTVSYEIGNFNGNTLTIRGSAQGLLADIPNDANITIRLLQEYEIDTDGDITNLLLGAALQYDDDPNQGYRIIQVTANELVANRFAIRALPTLNHLGVVVNGSGSNVGPGVNQFTINPIGYDEEKLLNRRLGYKGTIYKVTAYNTVTNVITLDQNLTEALIDQESVRLSPAPGATGKIFTDFSVVKAGNHDMLDIGTGAYEDSNYPRELYGPPVRQKAQSQEVTETAPGRVFFVTNDQDGNFRVGDYFRVNQGDGSVSFSASIALSNLDGLGFTRGVTVNEFSPDSDMSDISDEALPTEQAVVNYINKRLGQNADGIGVGLSRLGAGTLMLDGSQSMEGDFNLNNNDIINLGTLNTTNIDAGDTDTDTLTVNTTAVIQSAQISVLTDQRLVIAGASGVLTDSANLVFDGTNFTVDGNQVITGSLTVNGITTFSQMEVDNLTVTGEIFGGPLNTDDTRIAGNRVETTVSNSNLELSAVGTGTIDLLRPTNITGNVDITGTVDISSDLDVNGQTTLASLNVEDLTATRMVFSGTDGELVDNANLTFNSTTDELRLIGDISVNGKITVDEIELDSNTMTLDGQRIYGAGSAALGTIYLIPGFTGANLGDVEIFGNLSVTGTVSTTDVELANSQINGNLTVFGNTTLGDVITDGITFTARINSDILPLEDSTHSLGTDGAGGLAYRWANVYSDNLDSYSLNLREAGDISVFDSSGTPIETFAVDGATGFVESTGGLEITAAGDIRVYNNAATPAITFEVFGSTGNANFAGNVTVDGNLTVTGTVLSDLEIEDNVVILNSNVVGAPTTNAGVEVERGTSANVSIRWNETTDRWQITNDGSTYDDLRSATEITDDIADARTDSLAFNTSTGSITATRGDASTYAVDIDGRYVLDTGDSMTGTLTINLASVSNSSNTDLLYLKGVTADIGSTPMSVGIAFEIEDGNNSTNLSRIRSAAVNGTTYGDDDEAASNLIFSTTNAGTEADHMIITGRGNIGIKQLNPQYNLDITGTLNTTSNTRIGGTLTVATINEVVADAGVSVEGVLLKDSVINVDSIISQSTNTDLSLSGNGSGNVNITDSLDVDTITAYSGTNTNLTLAGKGSGTVTITSTLIVNSISSRADNSNLILSGNGNGNVRINDDVEATGTVKSDTLTTYNTDTNLTLTGNGTGIVYVNDNLDVNGTVSATSVTADTITSEAADTNLTLSANGTGVVVINDTLRTNTIESKDDDTSMTLSGRGTGNVKISDSLQVNSVAGYTLNADLTLSGNGNGNVKVSTALYVDVIESRSTNTDLNLSANGNGKVYINDTFEWTGTATGSITGNAGTITSQANSATITATSANTANQIVQRNASGNFSAGTITANLTGTASALNGTATTTNITTGAAATAGSITGNWSLTSGSRMQATYADLAEIYATDQEYEVGTVVMFGGDKEVTIANEYATTRVAGVISTDPAFIMNNMAEGQAVALKGRIPVKVQGIVCKGDFIIASNTPGVGIAVDNYIGGAVIGKAIEDKTTHDVGIIEVKV
tara:strand:+ start:1126 stop:9189 length:8064 start_codon:yes stop_codon:yes gene_type:complete